MSTKVEEMECPRDSSHTLTVLYKSVDIQGEIIRWVPDNVACDGGCRHFEQHEIPQLEP